MRTQSDPRPSRTAIVTGASRGLGRALAAALVGDGWTVVGDARDGDALRAVAHDLGPRFVPVVGDVIDPAHRAALLAAAGSRLDALVNNAGTLGPSPLPRLADLDPVDLRRTLEANTVAPTALVAEALGALRAAAGVVVDVTSDAAVEAYEGWGAYGASKAALDHLTRVFAAEEPGVRFHAVDPGDMRTAMHQAAFPGEDISDRPEAEASVQGVTAATSSPSAIGRLRNWETRKANSGSRPKFIATGSSTAFGRFIELTIVRVSRGRAIRNSTIATIE